MWRELKIDGVFQGRRLDRFLQELYPYVSRQTIYKNLRLKNILKKSENNNVSDQENGISSCKDQDINELNFTSINGTYKLQENDIFKVYKKLEEENSKNENSKTKKEKIENGKNNSKNENSKTKISAKKAFDDSIEIIYEDQDMMVINKPIGLASQGGLGLGDCHVLKSLERKCGVDELFLVHRLDKECSGVMVVARTAEMARVLSERFAGRTVEKTYLAFVMGSPKLRRGTMKLPLKKYGHGVVPVFDENEGKAKNVKLAVSQYQVLTDLGRVSLLMLKPITGRKHQLRIQCAALLNAPIIGDRKYDVNGLTKNLYNIFPLKTYPLFLHCHSLSFNTEDKKKIETKNEKKIETKNEKKIETKNEKKIEMKDKIKDKMNMRFVAKPPSHFYNFANIFNLDLDNILSQSLE